MAGNVRELRESDPERIVILNPQVRVDAAAYSGEH